jgi:transposase
MSKGFVRYWNRNQLDCTSFVHGGARNWKLQCEKARQVIDARVLEIFSKDPTATRRSIVDFLYNEYGVKYSPSFVSRLLVRYGLSYKIPTYR